MLEYVTAFVGGLLGSAHCIGMCGGFVALVGAKEQPLCRAASRQLTYALGRVFTYGFLGAVGGFAGLYLSRFDGALVSAQQIFSIIAGSTMILVGLTTLGVLRLDWIVPKAATGHLAALFRSFMNTPGRAGVFVAGAANGFLPCGLVYAFLAMAVATSSMMTGMATMVCFGAGTIPVMTLVGCGSTMITNRARGKIIRVAAILVIVTGAVSINRGLAEKGSCCSNTSTHTHAPA